MLMKVRVTIQMSLFKKLDLILLSVSFHILVTCSGGSVAYGLPTLAVTRRTGQNVKKLKEIEEINKKLC